METISAVGLAFLEMTFILVGLLILHGARNTIGNAAFLLSMGVLLIFTQIVAAASLTVIVGVPGADFYIAPTILSLPYLTALMVVYVTEGTLATQRLIIGAMATLGLYVYLSHITATQCNWLGYAISQGPSADSLNFLLRQSMRGMAATILAQTFDLFLIPIFFQRLRNFRCRMLIAIIGALLLTQLADHFIQVTINYWGSYEWWLHISSSYIAKSVATIWLGAIATIYLTRIETEAPGTGRGTLDIVFAFFGSYKRAKALERDIREWEGRYRMVVENASDMILILDAAGRILDTNFAAIKTMGFGLREEIINRSFPDMLIDRNDRPVNWETYSHSFSVEDTAFGPHIRRLECRLRTAGGETVELDMGISGIEAAGEQILVVLGRDVTERNRLAQEREDLRDQLIHSQRLESIGKLAGGVAHDFNNYLHAIQGHLDIITYMHEVKDQDVSRHITRVNEITDKASMLTKQLLGFARKGKYVEKRLEIGQLLRETGALFSPAAENQVGAEVRAKLKEAWIKGDPVQLQQVFLNLLINARDAVAELPSARKLIRVTLDEATSQKDHWRPPEDINLPIDDYICVTVADNGEGMPKEVMDHIFEPFFTTKPFGKGTGMGLAMAYGAISNHNGWIKVESAPGEGTAFMIFLPKS